METIVEKKPPAKYFLLSIETLYTDKHSCTMYHSSKRKLRPYLMTISVSQKKFFHIHASLKVKNEYSTVVLGSNNCTFCINYYTQ